MQLIYSKHRPRTALQAGVSLVELMIGIAIALILMAGVITAFVNLSTASTTTVKANRLNNELRSILNFITREVQKAGYVNAWDDSDADSDNHRLRTDLLRLYGDIILDDVSGTCNISTDLDTDANNRDTCDCILYRYDENNNGLSGTVDGVAGPGGASATAIDDDENEFFGFRYDENNQEIDIKIGGAFADADCTDGSWQAYTSNDVEITELSFQIEAFDSFNDGVPAGPLNEPTYLVGGAVIHDDNDDGDCEDTDDSCLDRRKLNVVIEGRLASDNAVTMRIESEIKLMNDHYFINP